MAVNGKVRTLSPEQEARVKSVQGTFPKLYTDTAVSHVSIACNNGFAVAVDKMSTAMGFASKTELVKAAIAQYIAYDLEKEQQRPDARDRLSDDVKAADALQKYLQSAKGIANKATTREDRIWASDWNTARKTNDTAEIANLLKVMPKVTIPS